ncbi:hypothetical protein FIBSPDRAFT_934990 [Athelia psychrophila]|uniref:Uncharacterized protein n=1 Tax=Athelia psychrophila TaxID=1759441 RepID=A0A166EL09_9AGAM|nr:hypothetical protein FIBSPDRAFT_934990 [Fibularhizoctonia sp. CBS 109695]
MQLADVTREPLQSIQHTSNSILKNGSTRQLCPIQASANFSGAAGHPDCEGRCHDSQGQSKFQSYTPLRDGNDRATPGRNLLVEGSAYSGTAGAFNNFRQDMCHTVNHGTGHATDAATQEDVDEEETSIDLEADVGVDIKDLAIDEEFLVGTDLADFVVMYHEMIDELSGDM